MNEGEVTSEVIFAVHGVEGERGEDGHGRVGALTPTEGLSSAPQDAVLSMIAPPVFTPQCELKMGGGIKIDLHTYVGRKRGTVSRALCMVTS